MRKRNAWSEREVDELKMELVGVNLRESLSSGRVAALAERLGRDANSIRSKVSRLRREEGIEPLRHYERSGSPIRSFVSEVTTSAAKLARALSTNSKEVIELRKEVLELKRMLRELTGVREAVEKFQKRGR